MKEFPNDPYFLELKGQIYAENGKVEEAIFAYQESLNQFKKPPPLIMLALANVLLEKKNSKKARMLLYAEICRSQKRAPKCRLVKATYKGTRICATKI